MFTSVFTNKYSDTSFKIVNFSRFLFIICTRKKTFSEEIEERRKDIPKHSPIFLPSCGIVIVNSVLHVISYVNSKINFKYNEKS